jgi:hypothetical protein
MGIPTALLTPPDTFCWDGVCCYRLSPHQWRLLQVLTDGPRLRDFVPFATVATHVYAGRRPPRDETAALKELVARVEAKLARARVRLFFEREDFCLRLVPY